MMKSIDINADLGEGAGFDEQLMPLISSCSIACGGHFGTLATMRSTVRLAKKHAVLIGAHPSFPDTNNFGRKVLTLTKSELTKSVYKQLMDFYSVCSSEGVLLHHVKLHGALYNYAAKDAPTADAVVDAILALPLRPKLYLPHGSILHKKAENLIPLVFEAFVDRNYNNDLSLVSRNKPNALIKEPDYAWLHLQRMVTQGVVRTISSEEKQIIATTYCIHGDHENSVAILNYIHIQLPKHEIKLA